MRLSNLRTEPKISEFGTETILIADVESVKFGKSTIWISISKEYETWFTTDRYDGFLVALLFCAMKNNEDIIVEGTVSKKLLRNLNNYIQCVLKSFTFYLNEINISAIETTSSATASTHIGTGFSGGVDSFYTVYERFACENDPDYKIDTLISFNTGHYCRADGVNQQLFRDDFSFLAQYAKEVDLPYAAINTNFGYYIEEKGFGKELRQFGPTFMAAVILSLQNRFSKYYIASNYSYLEMLQYACKDKPIRNMKNMIDGDYMETIIYHLFNTESLEIIVEGSQYKRTGKTKRIAEYLPFCKYVDVNGRFDGKKNAITGFKTNRTLWALESINKLDLYSDSFDINNWNKEAFLYKCKQVLFCNSNPFAKDNIEFAKANGKKVPFFITAFFCVYFYQKPLFVIKRTIKAIIRKLLK